MLRRALGILLLLAGPALAEDRAALLARSPALALDDAVRPLAGPVTVTQTGWGPFRRLCVTKTLLRPADGEEVPAGPANCFNVEDARQDGEVWRLAMRTDPLQGGFSVAFTTTRDARGAVGEVALVVPAGQPPPTPEQLAQIQDIFRLALQANGMERATVAPDTAFVIPLSLAAVDPSLRVEGGGFSCRAEGESRIGTRRVIVAACGAPARGEVSPGRVMTIELAGRFAIDVETGMVLRHGYASHLVMEADPRGSMGRMEIRGVSRLMLE